MCSMFHNWLNLELFGIAHTNKIKKMKKSLQQSGTLGFRYLKANVKMVLNKQIQYIPFFFFGDIVLVLFFLIVYFRLV